MIRYLEYNEIDKNKWDRCVENSGADLVYAYSWYLDLVSPEWSALIENDYSSVMPLPVKKKYGINYIIQPPFTQQLGIFTADSGNLKKISAFIKAIPDYYKFIDVNFNFSNDFRGSNSPFITNRNFELKLSQNIEHLKSAFSENTSRNIRKALNEILIKEDISLDEHMKLYEKYADYLRGKDQFIRIRSFMESLIQIRKAWITGAYFGEELCASVFMLKHSDRIYYLIPVSSRTGREKKAMSGIINNIIENYSSREIILDFEGSNHEGIARFFKGFGAVPVNYSRLRINRLPLPYKIFIKKHPVFKSK